MFFPLSFWEKLGDVYSLSESFPFDYDAMETNSQCDLLATSIDGKLKAPVEYKSVKVRIWICVPDSTSSSWIIQTIFEIFLWKEFEEKNESIPRFPIPHRKTTTRLMNIFITLNATKLIFRWAKFSFREKPLLTTSFKSCTDFLLPLGKERARSAGGKTPKNENPLELDLIFSQQQQQVESFQFRASVNNWVAACTSMKSKIYARAASRRSKIVIFNRNGGVFSSILRRPSRPPGPGVGGKDWAFTLNFW